MGNGEWKNYTQYNLPVQLLYTIVGESPGQPGNPLGKLLFLG